MIDLVRRRRPMPPPTSPHRLAFETDVSDVARRPGVGRPRLRAAGQPQRRGVGAGARARRGAPARAGRSRHGRPPSWIRRSRSSPTAGARRCNGATRAALALAQLGYRVREMLGGFEYWAREGLPVETADGVHRPAVDPLTAPAAVSCGC